MCYQPPGTDICVTFSLYLCGDASRAEQTKNMDVLWTIFYLDFVDLRVSIALIWMDSLVVQVEMQ